VYDTHRHPRDRRHDAPAPHGAFLRPL